jgi:cytochrome c-type biogenesis protein CcsB
MAAWAGAVSLVAVTLALLGSVPWNVANVEVFFNQFAPFYRCLILYVVAFLLVVAGWLAFLFGASKPFWRAAYWLTVLTFVVHTLAIMARIYIQERPPVTNLYSSAIFIGWVAVLLAIALEPIMRLGVVTAVGALAGFLTLIVAHHLGNDGDTMEMLQAVLDTNFWLATHVTTVTMGYAATFLAATLGVAYIYMGVFSPILKKDVNSILESIGARRLRVEMNVGKLLSTILYGVICGAMLLSFVGTVLGGIWADQSWGRFWGWDPKENGAVLIVIWNALILHARWGGMIGQRGMAMLATFGGVVTAWSWFGTNMLGVGLHSYGFIPSAVFWLVFYIVVQLVTIGIGWIPERYWLSHSDRSNMPARSGPLREEPVEAIIVG